MNPRAYLNLEKSHVETLLRLVREIASSRILNPTEQYIQMILEDTLDNIDIAI
jgi:hypothetical protein